MNIQTSILGPAINNYVVPAVVDYINTGDGSAVFHISIFLNNIVKKIDPKLVEEILKMTKIMVKHIELDLSSENLVRANLLCDGETERIQVEISYSKDIGPTETVLSIEDVKISRPWLNILYNEVLKDKMISKDDLTFSVDNFINSILK